jgi:hypothetical protein
LLYQKTTAMKYVKLLLNIPDGRGGKRISIEWNLVIETVGDLLKYAQVDAERAYAALFRATRKPDNSGFEVSHIDDHRQQQVAQLLNIKIGALQEGEKMYPIVELANVLDLKTKGMLNFIQKFGPVRVNEVGGYCGLQDYLMTWNGEILETIEKEDVGFPIEAEAINTEALILENQGHVNQSLYIGIETITGHKPKAITLMKEKDQKWVIESIMNAKTIGFESTFTDIEQIDKFMGLFLSMPKKRIIIKTYNGYKPVLTSHKLWEANNTKHEIIFLD